MATCRSAYYRDICLPGMQHSCNTRADLDWHFQVNSPYRCAKLWERLENLRCTGYHAVPFWDTSKPPRTERLRLAGGEIPDPGPGDRPVSDLQYSNRTEYPIPENTEETTEQPDESSTDEPGGPCECRRRMRIRLCSFFISAEILSPRLYSCITGFASGRTAMAHQAA